MKDNALELSQQIEIWKKANNGNVFLVAVGDASVGNTDVYIRRPDRYTIHAWLDEPSKEAKENILFQNCVLDANIIATHEKGLTPKSEQIISSIASASSELIVELFDPKGELTEEKGEITLTFNGNKYVLNRLDRSSSCRHSDLLRDSSKAAADYILKPYLKTYPELKTNDELYFVFLRALKELKVKPEYSLKKL